MQDEAFERMRQVVYAIAAACGRIGPDRLDRDHELRALLFAVFTAGTTEGACGTAPCPATPAPP